MLDDLTNSRGKIIFVINNVTGYVIKLNIILKIERMDIFDEIGELALGSRTSRLAERIMQEGGALYEQENVDFEAKHFALFYALYKKGEMGVTELAGHLHLSHPAIIKLAKGLEKKGYLESKNDQIDKRRRLLSLSKKGVQIAPQLEEIWIDVAQMLHELVQTQEHNLLQSVREMEVLLAEKSIAERFREVKNRRQLAVVEIIDFQPEFREEFARINYAWINQYFKVEDADVRALEHPETDILEKGGHIFFARYAGKIVGTCALKNLGNGRYELAKMGVDVGYQGKQIGKKLGLAIIEKAKAIGAKVLYLESNRKLKPALKLYKRLGFKELMNTGKVSDYARSDIEMELRF